MLESLSALLPTTIISSLDLPELVKSSLNSLSERKASVQTALTEVPHSPPVACP